MVVVDGIVMGPTHCAMEGCHAEVNNYRGGVFCRYHNIQYEPKCRVKSCDTQKVASTEACEAHKEMWNKHKSNYSSASLSGLKRALQCRNENLAWLPNSYFSPNRYYCVETVCAPCGVVIAWKKFVKSESTANIMELLNMIYPIPDSCPAYICIDKACLVLHSVLKNILYRPWLLNSRFVVDGYHYTNHKADDDLCRTFCNPAPSDGSAPNLVIIEHDRNGQPYYKRAFNTQACEQLNSWLGGFESILKRMTVSNFNWFLHAMLVYHTQCFG
ncbi:hypothetical protein BDQ17DRAFT_1394734 [Cyathus striatus]|nr:hypothetical protein BDQ17DRAFT_1394734 [Cyathus striatus]